MTDSIDRALTELATAAFWEASYQENCVAKGRWWSRHLYHLICTTPMQKSPLIVLTQP